MALEERGGGWSLTASLHGLNFPKTAFLLSSTSRI